jgi:hypothetical protein
MFINGSSMSFKNRLESLCDIPTFARLKPSHSNKTSVIENIFPSVSK